MKEKLIQIARTAGQAIMEIYHSADFGVEMKSDNSPLTKADKAAHNIIVEGLEQFGYPILSEEGAKTSYEVRKDWKRFWMVDPLDGTKEFIKKNDEFTVNIALIEAGKPIFGVVYAPALGDLYYGSVGKGAFKLSFDATNASQAINIQTSKPGNKLIVVASRSHNNEETKNYIATLEKNYKTIEIISKGSSLKLVEVAEGKAHIYPRFGPTMEWDTAAAHAVVLAAGGTVKQPNGQALVYNKEDLLNPFFIVKG